MKLTILVGITKKDHENIDNMKLTAKGRYAVMAMADLAANQNLKPVSLNDIALRQNISLSYLEQLFSKLKDKKLVSFNSALFNVLLNLAKRVAADGEGASKFVTIKVKNCKTEEEAKKICFSIANSPLVKTAIAGEDPNWGRIIMAIGKANVNLNPNKLSIKIGNISIIENGKLCPSYDENEAAKYMKEEKIDLLVNLNLGKKEFSAYTMDLTKKYIEINSDYRT